MGKGFLRFCVCRGQRPFPVADHYVRGCRGDCNAPRANPDIGFARFPYRVWRILMEYTGKVTFLNPCFKILEQNDGLKILGAMQTHQTVANGTALRLVSALVSCSWGLCVCARRQPSDLGWFCTFAWFPPTQTKKVIFYQKRVHKSAARRTCLCF